MRMDAWGFPAIELAHTFFQVLIEGTSEASIVLPALRGFAFCVAFSGRDSFAPLVGHPSAIQPTHWQNVEKL